MESIINNNASAADAPPPPPAEPVGCWSSSYPPPPPRQPPNTDWTHMYDYSQEFSRFACIMQHLRPLANWYMENAAFEDTKQHTLTWAWIEIGKVLGVFNEMYFRGHATRMCVHADNVAEIDRMVASLVKCNRSDQLTLFYRLFKICPNITDVQTVRNLVRELVKRNEISREGPPTGNNSKKERIIKNTELNRLLAVDGLSGVNSSDVQLNYLDNLSYGTDYTSAPPHVRTVRYLYDVYVSPNITGVDAAILMRLVLLRVYKRFCSEIDRNDKIVNAITTSRDHLVRYSRDYPELLEALSKVEQMIADYNFWVNVSLIAEEKIDTFIKYYKSSSDKRNNRTNFGGGQKRRRADSSRSKRQASGIIIINNNTNDDEVSGSNENNGDDGNNSRNENDGNGNQNDSRNENNDRNEDDGGGNENNGRNEDDGGGNENNGRNENDGNGTIDGSGNGATNGIDSNGGGNENNNEIISDNIEEVSKVIPKKKKKRINSRNVVKKGKTEDSDIVHSPHTPEN